MLKRPPKLFALLLRNPALGDGTGNADIKEIKLPGFDDYVAVLPPPLRLEHRAKKRIDKNLDTAGVMDKTPF